MQPKNIIIELSLEFALAVVAYAELLEERKKHVIGRQLLKSGTSIGANVWEAQSAESMQDFLHKMKIAAKEIEETEYWLLICSRSDSYPECSGLQEKLATMKKIISKIIFTGKTKAKEK